MKFLQSKLSHFNFQFFFHCHLTEKNNIFRSDGALMVSIKGIHMKPSTKSVGLISPGQAPGVEDDSILKGLSYAQLDFMQNIQGFERRQIADYLRCQTAVQVVVNNEVSEAPDFALEVTENLGYWLGCFHTVEAAEAAADLVGLPIANRLKERPKN